MTPTKVEEALAVFNWLVSDFDAPFPHGMSASDALATLTAALADAEAAAKDRDEQIKFVTDAAIEAQTALAESERDAARYRWLRENNGSWKVQTAITKKEGDDHRWVYAIEGLDTAIDAAMKDTDYAR